MAISKSCHLGTVVISVFDRAFWSLVKLGEGDGTQECKCIRGSRPSLIFCNVDFVLDVQGACFLGGAPNENYASSFLSRYRCILLYSIRSHVRYHFYAQIIYVFALDMKCPLYVTATALKRDFQRNEIQQRCHGNIGAFSKVGGRVGEKRVPSEYS